MLLFSLVSTQHWAHAAIVLYYYWLCIVYGFGTVIVAMDASREFESHTRALNELRLTFLTSCYLGWGAHHGSATERRDAKDICLQVKEVRSAEVLLSNARTHRRSSSARRHLILSNCTSRVLLTAHACVILRLGPAA